MKSIMILLCVAVSMLTFGQQGVAVNTDGSVPASSAMLDVKSTDKGMLVPRMTTAQRTAILNVAKGLLVFDNTTSSFWFYNGTDWTELASDGSSEWTVANNHISNTNSGNVGIGTSAPSSKLHVVGNIRSSGRIDADGVIEGAGVSALGALYVTGSALMEAGLNVGGNINSGTSMSITDPAGILEFKNGGDKAFVQLSGDDLRVGTFSSNTAGRFIVRTQGANQAVIDQAGIDLPANGKVTRTLTGSKNLLPVCYGRVGFGGSSYSGTPNFTASSPATGEYLITCPQFTSSTVILVTMNQYQGGQYTYPVVENSPAGSTSYKIRFYNTSLNSLADAGFSFVAYENEP